MIIDAFSFFNEEELAQLRADTSIQKTILGKTIPSSGKVPDSVSIIRKGD